MQYFTTKYERNQKNRTQAIKIHGTSCCVCGFNFEKTYGILGNSFIEVHHIIRLSHKNEEIPINPTTDLICVCSNCHRMMHRRKDRMMTHQDLINIITEQKKKFK